MKEPEIQLSNNNLGAWRIFSLFMLLLQNAPLPSSYIYSALYADMSPETAARTFNRDRSIISRLGFIINAIKNGKEKSFYLSSLNFYDSKNELTQQTADTLLVICSAVLTDSSFVYQKELRYALTKLIGNIYTNNSQTLQNAHAPSTFTSKMFSLLYKAYTTKKSLEITYSNAQGLTKHKQLNIFDFFMSQENLYFVAQNINRTSESQSIKTYRVDRILDAAILSNSSYAVPKDFDPKNYELLDFQLGTPKGLLTAFVPNDLIASFAHFSQGQGDVKTVPDGLLWSVSFAYEEKALTWIISHGLIPRSPNTLLVAWKKIMNEAAYSY